MHLSITPNLHFSFRSTFMFCLRFPCCHFYILYNYGCDQLSFQNGWVPLVIRLIIYMHHLLYILHECIYIVCELYYWTLFWALTPHGLIICSRWIQVFNLLLFPLKTSLAYFAKYLKTEVVVCLLCIGYILFIKHTQRSKNLWFESLSGSLSAARLSVYLKLWRWKEW